MSESFLNDRVTLRSGDCRDVLARLEECSVDSCVTDPPYHLTSIVKRFGAENAAPAKAGKTGAYARASAGFMGKRWDGGDIAFQRETWAAVWRVLKPGAHLVAFSGTRTYHRMACAIEDAGFEIRDQIAWTYGSGFPKSHNIGNGWGTALKPAWEPIVLARKPLIGTVADNVRAHGTGALNIDGCRVASGDGDYDHPGNSGIVDNCNVYGDFSHKNQSKPHTSGRWPANVVHDGSDEVVALFPQVATGKGGGADLGYNGGGLASADRGRGFGDSGSAARFFYTAKADADDRIGSKHPTVKPRDLMQWLVRLVTPPGGVLLDPFAGTGTTGEAAFREGLRAILIEAEPEYQQDIRRRMTLCLAGPDERQRESIKASGKAPPAESLPLFAT
jgi:site-specific DNA-methyltransferase (adenine-specific)